MPTWPVSLPTSWGSDAKRDRESNILRTTMDAGPPKQRRRATASFVATPFTVLLTTAQKETLDAFYLTDCKEALAFDWKDFSVSGTPPTRSFRFLAPPVYQYVSGLYWMATLQLEQLP